ncbi:MAG: cation transporter [Gemmatimonadaceae bacterium]
MCAHTVRVALRKIEGVESADVSLKQGVATVRFKPDNRIAVDQIRDVVRSNGFTPKAAEVRIRGSVIEEKGELLLAVPGRDQVYHLGRDPNAPAAIERLRQVAGREVIIEGTAPEAAKGQARVEPIRVRSVSDVIKR